jgi:hypothetical protein
VPVSMAETALRCQVGLSTGNNALDIRYCIQIVIAAATIKSDRSNEQSWQT